jgi:DNA-binding MarR family transcriptional regulator
MPLIIDEGENFEDLVKASGLDSSIVHTSLKRLVNLNLVNSRGDHRNRRYSLHNLTRMFLQTEILKTSEWN